MKFALSLVPQETLRKERKWVVYQELCEGLHCNQFGTAFDCRGCYESCEAVEEYYSDLGIR